MFNSASILWYSKRQSMVETSTFGSEFVALRIATVLVQGLRCELRMMDVPLDGPTSMYCDNVSVTRMHRYHNLLYCAITKSDRVWRPDGFRSCGLNLRIIWPICSRKF